MDLEERTLPSTFTVVNLHDSGNGSLRAAIAAANANPGADTIKFAKDLSGTIKLTSGQLLISDSVTIDGPGSNRITVSGNDASRVFEIATGQDVTISWLTISHGHAADTGGGILINGSNLTLSGDDLSHNVAFESATSGARGGAIKSVGGALTVTDCRITNNQALGADGPSAHAAALGGGFYILAGSVTISNSTFSGNLARGGDIGPNNVGVGGGIIGVGGAEGGCSLQ